MDDTDDDDEDDETPGVDGETQGVDELKLTNPKVTKIVEISGMKTTRRPSHTFLWVHEPAKTAKKRYDNKSLQKQSHKEYDVFNIIEETESNKGVMPLQIDPGIVDIFNAEKATTDIKNEMMDEEYI